MANRYETTTGEKITDATISARLTKSYRQKYAGEPPQSCHSCGKPAEGSAHPIPKARLRSELHMADKIYHPDFYFPSCHRCNLAWEVPEGDGWKTAFNREEVLELIQKYDPVLYSKFERNL